MNKTRARHVIYVQDMINTKIWSENLKKKHRLGYTDATEKTILKWIISER